MFLISQIILTKISCTANSPFRKYNITIECSFESKTLMGDELLLDPLASDLGFSVKLAAYTWAVFAEVAGVGTT